MVAMTVYLITADQSHLKSLSIFRHHSIPSLFRATAAWNNFFWSDQTNAFNRACFSESAPSGFCGPFIAMKTI
jgi:hypothetical protein